MLILQYIKQSQCIMGRNLTPKNHMIKRRYAIIWQRHVPRWTLIYYIDSIFDDNFIKTSILQFLMRLMLKEPNIIAQKKY